jgi:hypothetical protein
MILVTLAGVAMVRSEHPVLDLFADRDAAGRTAQGVLAAAAELSTQPELLRAEVAKFMQTVRAA